MQRRQARLRRPAAPRARLSRGALTLVALVWTVLMVCLLTAWHVVVLHQPLRGADVAARVLVFGVAGALLGWLVGRLQGRQG